MLKKMFMAFRESQKAVRSERLHQTLHRAKPQLGLEAAVKRHSVLDLLLAIVRNQLGTLRFGKSDIRIVDQRSEIILRKAGPQNLEIDKISLCVSDNDVLRLKIAVHQDARQASKLLGNLI